MKKFAKRFVEVYLIYVIGTWCIYGISEGILGIAVGIRENEKAEKEGKEPPYKFTLAIIKAVENFKEFWKMV